MIDSHAHLNASYTVDSVDDIITSFTNQGGTAIIDVTTTLEDVPVSQSFIQRHKRVIWATVGIHPEEVQLEAPDATLEALVQLEGMIAGLDNIVGIGETGLDYKHAFQTNDPQTIIKYQTELFTRHLLLAKRYKLPLVIHARGVTNEDASPYAKILQILEQEQFSLPVYFHSFAGDTATAQKVLERNDYIGVNGIVTYTGAKVLAEVVAATPLSHILLETDSPYLIPSNADRTVLVDKSINEPKTILYTAKRIAALKKISELSVLEETEKNTRTCFAKIS